MQEVFTYFLNAAKKRRLTLTIGIMPQPALTVFLVVAAIVIVAVCVAVIVIALRAHRRRKLAETLEKRRDDEVQYAFVVNPSKPQATARRLHIQEFCKAKGLNRVRFYDTQLDKDGRACALEALEDGADVVIAVGGDGTVRTVASAVSGTGHALGIVPIGTGNLFARNMGIPVDDIDAALTVATSHGSRMVDMGRLTLLDHPEDDHGHAFLIIAGIGFDADARGPRSKQRGQAFVDPGLCNGCGLCVQVCPFDALSMTEPQTDVSRETSSDASGSEGGCHA